MSNLVCKESSPFPSPIVRYAGQAAASKGVKRFSSERIKLSKDVAGAFEDMVLELDGEFLNFFKRLTRQQREILISISKGRSSPSEIAKDIGKPITSISPQLARMLNLGILEKFDNKYRISDPVFHIWLREILGVEAQGTSCYKGSTPHSRLQKGYICLPTMALWSR